MVDLSKISEAVQKFVKETAKVEGHKRQIDSKKEYYKLAEYLSGHKDSMNVHEQNYIQGFMIEYESKAREDAQKAEQKRVDEVTTENTKKLVKQIAKRLGDKKTIDTDSEAQELAALLRNTKGDLNKADLEYIIQILINSGYESYIPKDEEMDVKPEPKAEPKPELKAEPKPEPKPEPKAEPKPEPKAESKPEPKAESKPEPKAEPKPEPKAESKPEPKAESKPELKPFPIPFPVPKPGLEPVPEPVTSEYVITEKDRNEGFRLANLVKGEINGVGMADNRAIKEALNDVNSKTVYSFISQFINPDGGLNKEVFSVKDLFNKIRYSDTLHVMESLQHQARDMGLEDNSAYKVLQEEINNGRRVVRNQTEVDPAENTRERADRAIRALYQEMSKVLA